MFNIKLSTETFNKVLKRLCSASSGDPSAILTLDISNNELYFYYRSKLDKSEAYAVFREKVEYIALEGKGSASIFIKDIINLKIPDFVRDTKFPYCKEIDLKFDKTALTIDYKVFWAEKKEPNGVAFSVPTINEKEDFSLYSKLSQDMPSYIEVNSKDLIDSILYCNFFKHDATTKSSNGCLFKLVGDEFLIVGTDSNIASCYRSKIIFKENVKEDIKTILSDSVFKLVKGFIYDLQTVRISINKSSLSFSTGNRKMIVPTVNSEYIINNPEEFFILKGSKLADLYLRPLISLVSLFTSSSKDDYKTVVLSIENNQFCISCEENKSTEIPAEIFNSGVVYLNGDYFNVSAQRFANVDEMASLYYDSSTRRASLTSPDSRLTFLIQGQRES